MNSKNEYTETLSLLMRQFYHAGKQLTKVTKDAPVIVEELIDNWTQHHNKNLIKKDIERIFQITGTSLPEEAFNYFEEKLELFLYSLSTGVECTSP